MSNRYPYGTRCTAASCALMILLGWDLALGQALSPSDVSRWTEVVKRTGSEGQGHAEAIAAMRELRRTLPEQVPLLLVAMDDANPLAMNWLRNAVEQAASREGTFPTEAVTAFLADHQHAPQARRLAYELLADRDPTVEQRLLPTMRNDPSPEIRWDAVRLAVEAAEKESDPQQKIEKLVAALDDARDATQVQAIISQLKTLGREIDLNQHFGFLLSWQLVGPFNSADQNGFTTAYPPESRLDLSADYPGKEGTISWKSITTSKKEGIVDLNELLGKHKDAVAYATAEYTSDSDQQVQVSLGCINGNKVWVNGTEIMANEKYHQAIMIDQYVAPAMLKRGSNRILVKICQNNQTEPWAQDWMFQLRISDASGRAIRSDTNRTAFSSVKNRSIH